MADGHGSTASSLQAACSTWLPGGGTAAPQGLGSAGETRLRWGAGGFRWGSPGRLRKSSPNGSPAETLFVPSGAPKLTDAGEPQGIGQLTVWHPSS